MFLGDPGNAFHATQVLKVAAKVPATVVPLSSDEGISASDAEGYLVFLKKSPDGGVELRPFWVVSLNTKWMYKVDFSFENDDKFCGHPWYL